MSDEEKELPRLVGRTIKSAKFTSDYGSRTLELVLDDGTEVNASWNSCEGSGEAKYPDGTSDDWANDW
jgi:hypothetical protein